MFQRLTALVLLAIAAASPGPARAALSYDSCTGFIEALPATITTQGTWCLKKDLATALAGGEAIAVNTNNVVIDCNGYKIGNLAAGTGTSTRGVNASSRLNTTVRNCLIRGFYIGIVIAGETSGNLVEDNQIDSSRALGFYLVGSSSIARGNRVVDTGGSTFSAGAAQGIALGGGADAVDNTITGVVPTPLEGDGQAIGIHVESFSTGSLVRGNAIREIVRIGEAISAGIYVGNATGVQLRENHIVGPIGTGITCANVTQAAVGNFVASADVGIANCTLSNNVETD